MEVLLFLIYIAIILALVFWFQKILKQATGQTELNWPLTIISYLAAFGAPSVALGVLGFIIKVIVFIFV